MKKEHKRILIISLLAVILLLLTIVLVNTQYVNDYGNLTSNHFKSIVSNCELINREFIVINGFMFNEFINKTIQVKGITFFNVLLIQEINASYDPKTACFEKHKEDIILETLNYTIKSNEHYVIEYNLINNQDQRLFYECTLNINCSIIREYFTGYLNPGDEKIIYFNITCPEGDYSANITTLFIDELTNRHYTINEVLINSTNKTINNPFKIITGFN